VLVTLEAMGLADITPHVIGCHWTQATRVQHLLDHVAGNTPSTYCSPRPTMAFNSRNEG